MIGKMQELLESFEEVVKSQAENGIHAPVWNNLSHKTNNNAVVLEAKSKYRQVHASIAK